MHIKLENLSKNYGITKVLINLTYTFFSPGLYIIFGPSGSGKTTLLNILGQVEKVEEKMVIFEPNRSTNHPSIIFQHHYLIGDLTAYENVVLPLEIKREKFNKKAIYELFKEYQLAYLMNRKIKDCSGGERQRVNLMRAISISSTYLLADEPTGSVDVETAQFIKQELVKLSQTKLVIIVTHDQNLFADTNAKYLKIERGRLNEI